MKKLSLSVLFVCMISGTIFAQEVKEKKAGFQVNFFPPLSTQGLQAAEYTNAASFSILAGVSKNITAFSLSALGTYVVNDVGGVHIAGLGTYAGGNGNGFMLSGLLNRTADFSGIGMSGLANIAGEVNGFQLGGLLNLAKGEGMRGAQLSGLANIGGAVNGFQLSGLFNQARGEQMHGMQFSGLANVANNVNGVQLAGLINVAKHVKGLQFAALVNIAETNDYPVGLVNIIKNGEMSIGVSYNEIGSTVVAFRSGGRILYGIIGVGYNHKAEKEQFVVEGGFGAHIPISGRFRINNEIRSQFLNDFSDRNMMHSGFSIMPAFKILPQWEVFGGPSINYMETDYLDNKSMFPSNNIWKKYTDDKLQQVYLGFSVGTHFLF